MRRLVTATMKDSQGDILGLCSNWGSWSPRYKVDAINDIETGFYQYYVSLLGLGDVDIHVVNGPNGKYLRTDPDKTLGNNLDSLPDCQ